MKTKIDDPVDDAETKDAAEKGDAKGDAKKGDATSKDATSKDAAKARAAAKAKAGRERAAGQGTRITNLVLGVVVVALAVAVVWVGMIVLDQKRDAEDRAKALQAARQMGVNLMTVDHATAQKDLDRMLSGATGDLKNQLATQSKTFIDTVAKAQTKSTVSQVDAAVVSIDGDSAEVMVSLNGMVTNPKVPNGVTRPYRYQMDLTKTGDRWLVSKLEMVP